MEMGEPIRWGIIATGSIAKKFARGLKHTASGELLAVGSRTQEKADAFGDEFGVAIAAEGSRRIKLAGSWRETEEGRVFDVPKST